MDERLTCQNHVIIRGLCHCLTLGFGLALSSTRPFVSWLGKECAVTSDMRLVTWKIWCSTVYTYCTVTGHRLYPGVLCVTPFTPRPFRLTSPSVTLSQKSPVQYIQLNSLRDVAAGWTGVVHPTLNLSENVPDIWCKSGEFLRRGFPLDAAAPSPDFLYIIIILLLRLKQQVQRWKKSACENLREQ